MVARDRLLAGFRLGEYHVDPVSGRVTGSAGSAHLPPKAMAVLLHLCEHAPAVVSRHELLRLGWGEAERSHEKLSHAVRQIRQALSDDLRAGRFIETVPKQGYRLLVAPALEPAGGTRPGGQESSPLLASVSFIAELRSRGVIETGVAYLVLGWLLIQIAAVTFEHLSLPPSAPAFVTYLVIVGFPITLVLAWFVELTPQGAVLDLDPDARRPHRSFGKHYVSILGALAVSSAGVFIYDRYVGLPAERGAVAREASAAEIAVDPNSIAVLPFLNIGGGEEGEILSVGLTEDVINLLARVPGLRVASRGDSFSLAPNSRSADVRRRLRVAYYLEGSVRVVDDTLRVVVQLIDSAHGTHLVSRVFDRMPEDFFAILDEITRLTVANLRVALPEATRAAIEVAAEDTDLDAYRLYRRGMAALRRPATAATIDEALEAFAGALGVDAGYAAAHAGVCMTHAAGYRVTHDARHIEAAEGACAAALGLNPNLDVVHNALGELYAETGQLRLAEAAFESALAINPNAADSLIGLGYVCYDQNRLEEAEEKLRLAIGLQPGNWSAYNALGGFYFLNGHYEEAAQQYREVVSLDADNVVGWSNLAAALMASGAFTDAAAAFERVVGIDPTQEAYANLGLLHYYLGETQAAVAALESALAIAPNYYLAWSNLGDVWSFSAAPERSLEAFARAEALAERRLEVNPRDAATLRDLAWIKAMLGALDEARMLITRAGEIDPSDPQIPYVDALIHVRRGDSAIALERLETAVRMGHSPALIAADPHLERLRSEPRFQALLARPVPASSVSDP